MNMNTNMGTTVYWHENQFITRLKLQLTLSGLSDHITDEHIEILRTQDPIKSVLKQLPVPIDVQCIDVHHLPQLDSGGIVDFIFCHSINPKTQSQPDMELIQGNGGAAGMGTHDHTLAVINQINSNFALVAKEDKKAALNAAFKTAFNVAFEAAPNAAQSEAPPAGILGAVGVLDILDLNTLPRWLKAGTPPITVGCPISPPIPVEESSASGRWKLQFSQLPDALQEATGKDVWVLVLDTLPAPDQISWAAEKAGSSNALLQEMTNGMRSEEPFNAVPPAINCKPQFVPNVVVGTASEPVVTGKDIYGRHGGFSMEDHGLFIAGIIRDLAPEVNIECIRVLNDFAVGDICTLHEALINIYDRMSKGDLKDKSVVINLSLVMLPPEDDIPEGVTEDILESTRDALYRLLQPLADLGAIFVAAAGNDSDPRMNASEKRFGPRYPAALASDDHAMKAMISVGAVNRDRHAARYSNYPDPYGIATYGGDLPKPEPWLPSAMDHVVARVDTNDIDALRGVYTAAQYPALSRNDAQYSAPNSRGWAYWSGTSFATPIISALAARVLQGRDPKSIDVRQHILDAARHYVMWTTVGEDGKDIPGRMIMATQEWQPDKTSTM
jgi:hypothetical protein